MAARFSSLTGAVLAALDAWPLSDRELAKRAGIPAPSIVKMRRGEGFGASEDVARRIRQALAEWRGEMWNAERQVRAAERRIARELERAGRDARGTSS